MSRKVLLSYGLGVESTVLLKRWLDRPQCRGFDLKDLIVITAMTGDEFEDTRVLVETHILPLLRQHGIRYVQVARNGLYEEDGVSVLSDTTSPTQVHLPGRFKLSEELTLAGTLPQMASGRRICSIKFKGYPLDWWTANNIGDEPYTHVIGFNAEETGRAERDQVYGGATFANRTASYPLIEWGWGRVACEEYLRRAFKTEWKKSCCFFCPFSRGQEHILDRYRDHPVEAGRALFLEHLCLALNPNMNLYGTKSLFDVLTAAKNAAALAHFRGLLDGSQYNLYRVRRIQYGKRVFRRDVKTLATGTREQVNAEFDATFGSEPNRYGIRESVTVARKQVYADKAYPVVEERYAVAPAGAVDKSGAANFDQRWKEFRSAGKKVLV